MTLRLELDRILYDPQEGLLHLFATDGEMFIRCAVSKAAPDGAGRRRARGTRCHDHNLPSEQGAHSGDRAAQISPPLVRARRRPDRPP